MNCCVYPIQDTNTRKYYKIYLIRWIAAYILYRILISLDIITLVYPRNHQEINSYIQKRTDKFSSNATEDQEIIDYVDNEIDENLSIKNL